MKATFFCQKCGIAMGRKLAPALATIVIVNMEKLLAESLCKPLLWRLYINNVLKLWPHSEVTFKDFVQWLNSLLPRLRFKHQVSTSSVVFLRRSYTQFLSFFITGKLSTLIYYRPPNTFSFCLWHVLH